jgi:hypothetical protein
MSVAQQVFGWVGILQGFLLLATLLWRGHYRRLPMFTMYVGGVRVFTVVYILHPTWEAWMLLAVVGAALRFGVAIELTYRIFGAFPLAAVTARRVLLVFLVATAVMAWVTRPARRHLHAHARGSRPPDGVGCDLDADRARSPRALVPVASGAVASGDPDVVRAVSASSSPSA